MVLAILPFSLHAQKEGYWDKERAISKEIVLSARERVVIPVEPLPEGSTELVYRITLLDENQQLTQSLASILKAIPDPTGISQGASGAILLLSKIAGSDHCRYAVFTEKESAALYVSKGNTAKACLVQKKEVNKDARRITLSQSGCFKSGNLWFGFESKNLVLSQKIVLEIVPWVDYNLSRGWNVGRKKELLKTVKGFTYYQGLHKPDAFGACFLQEITRKFTFSQYTTLLPIEKEKLYDELTKDCVEKTGESLHWNRMIRDRADKAFRAGEFDKAIAIIQEDIIKSGKATAMDYGHLGRFYLLTKQFSKAEESFRNGIALNSNEIGLQLGLAHVFLYTNRLAESKDIHKMYGNQNVSAAVSWKKQVEQDFKTFQQYGLSDEDFNKILRVLN